MDTKSSTKGEVVTTLRLPISEHQALKLLAEREGRSINSQLRYMLRQAGEHEKAAA